MLSRSKRKLTLNGSMTAILTAFSRDDTVNTKVMAELTDFAITRCNATAVTVAAAEAQEAVRLRYDEKLACIGAVVDAANGRVPVVAGISDTSTYGVVQLAKEAQDIGADVVYSMPPYGTPHKGSISSLAEEEIVSFYGDVSRAVDTPLMVYNSATLTPHMHIRMLARIFENDNVIGLSETSTDYQDIVKVCVNFADKVSVLVHSQVILPGLQLGAHASINPVGISKLGSEIFQEYEKEDFVRAMEIEKLLCQVPPEELAHVPRISFYKEVLTQMGFAVGLPRKPRTLLNDKEKARIGRFIKDYGLDKLVAT